MQAATRINNWDVIEVQGEPTVKDTDLAERLGFERPRDIRKLIKRMIECGNFFGATPWRTEEIPENGGKIATVFSLNEKQALKVISKSETKKADEIMDEVIDVFISFRKGNLNSLNSSQAQKSRINLDEISELDRYLVMNPEYTRNAFVTAKFDAYEAQIDVANAKHQVTAEKLNMADYKLQLCYEKNEMNLMYMQKKLDEKDEEIKKKDEELRNCQIEINRLQQSIEDNAINMKLESMPVNDNDEKVTCSIGRKNITKSTLLKILKIKYFTNSPNHFIGKKTNVAVTDIPTILKYFNMDKKATKILDESDFNIDGVFSDKLVSFQELLKLSNDEKKKIAIQRIKNNDKPINIKKDLLISEHYYKQCIKESKITEEISE